MKSAVEIEPYKQVSLVLKTENGTVLHCVLPYFETYVKLSDEEERRLRSEVNEMETKEKNKC
ncbi:hypothetical protein JS44_09455 [Anoxybacillus flavithermus]|uniref:Uncharacterized protein n=1 Tax=Anoxybacillus flavithermus TaxID=33934 RepID=A0A094J2W9_9BACL|nr:hypothetical protein JS44_09455 [Anoxybacillus flavithermus]